MATIVELSQVGESMSCPVAMQATLLAGKQHRQPPGLPHNETSNDYPMILLQATQPITGGHARNAVTTFFYCSGCGCVLPAQLA